MGWTATEQIGDLNPQIAHTTGRFYASPIGTVFTGTAALSANTLYAVPFFVPTALSYATINIEVTTGAVGKNARLGIYADTDGVPDALVVDAGTVSVAGTGNQAITINQQLAAGWYWLAIVSDGTPTVRSGGSAMPWLGFTSATDTTLHTGWSVAFAYAALPDPFTGGGALMTTDAPRLMLGV